jgi:hypothetical protein
MDRAHMAPRDPAESPRTSIGPDFPEIEARDLLSCAIRAFPGQLPLARAAFEQHVLNVCSADVARAIADAGGGQGRAAHEIVARIVTEVRSMPNPWLALRCLPIVFSLPCGEGETQSDLALEFGLTKGAVSDVCIRLCDRFATEPGRGMKRRAARESYAKRQRGKCARPRPVPWIFSGMLREAAGR